MKRFFFTLAAVAFAAILIASADVQASGPKGGSKSISKSSINVSKTKASNTKVSIHVNVYHRSYRGWNQYCWFPTYGCYGFYDPTCGCWFYWYQPAGEFRPITAMATNVPTTSGSTLLPPGAVNLPTPGTTSPGTTSAPLPPEQPVTPAPVDMPPTENP